METRLKIIIVAAILLFIVAILNFVKKDNISIKYSLTWLISGIILIILTLVPNLLELMSKILGFELVSNMIFVLAILILLVISFSFTIIVTRQTQKIRLLIQEVSLMKMQIERIEDLVETKKGKK